MVAVFQQFGTTEILIILVILLVLFGAKKLPELGKGLGKGIKEFRSGVKSVNDEVAEGLRMRSPRPTRRTRGRGRPPHPTAPIGTQAASLPPP